MARLYADENYPFPVVEELRRLGHDVLTAQEAGQANLEIPDEQVLAFANTDQRAVLTINRKHFVRLHRNSAAHSGIIVCTTDFDFIGQAQRIDEGLRQLETLNGQLIRIYRPTR